MQIHFCGVRGSTPAAGIEFVRYGGHTACVALAHDDVGAPTLVLDAGAGLVTLSRLLAGAPFIGTIMLSHLHWDHVLGLPFFAAADRPDAYTRVLVPEQDSGPDHDRESARDRGVGGSGGAADAQGSGDAPDTQGNTGTADAREPTAGWDGAREATAVLAGFMSPPYFPIEPTQLRGNWTFGTIAPGEHEVERFTVLAREIPHKGGRTFGYRVSDGHSTVAYIPDHCPTLLGPGEDGFGEYHAAAIELARDADVLIHDAHLFPEELAAEAAYGHSVADYAVELGRHAGASSVVLFHHRHTRTDDALDGLARRWQDASPKVTVAAEGAVIDLAARPTR
ncbi:MAG TPA: MBL fold metallo-hydrolase [Solirubrobacteraceae bacterium]|nr:MBL fold metallo-hydrolase [Solirubrobacteraceae bacterium]